MTNYAVTASTWSGCAVWPATQALALGIVRRLLIWRFGDYALDIAVIKAEHVRCFFTQEAKRYSKPASTGTVAAALRGTFAIALSRRCRTRPHGALSYPPTGNWPPFPRP
jgi:hypothetical protein